MPLLTPPKNLRPLTHDGLVYTNRTGSFYLDTTIYSSVFDIMHVNKDWESYSIEGYEKLKVFIEAL